MAPRHRAQSTASGLPDTESLRVAADRDGSARAMPACPPLRAAFALPMPARAPLRAAFTLSAPLPRPHCHAPRRRPLTAVSAPPPRAGHGAATPPPPPPPSPPRRAALRLLRGGAQPVRYADAWAWQHALAAALRADAAAPDTLLTLEHAPVYTLGTSSDAAHVLFRGRETALAPPSPRRARAAAAAAAAEPPPEPEPDAPELVRTERGGEVTYHGPGQLVVYPVLDLRRHKQDLHWYLRALEETVVLLLQREFGLDAGRRQGLTGVWVGDAKIAAVGLKVSRWVTMHGLALNVDLDLAPFRRIVPCGIADAALRVSSLKELLGPDRPSPTVAAVRDLYIDAFCDVFGPYDRVEVPLAAKEFVDAHVAVPNKV